MPVRHFEYLLADKVFYDEPARAAAGHPGYLAGRDVPACWQVRTAGPWTVLTPPSAVLPRQGWKMHVSACQANAAQVLDTVWDYCLSNQIGFKFLRSTAQLTARNAKYAERSGSGKFITVYPRNETQLERVLAELGDMLSGQPGPYILSDARVGAGPLYVRYGGFAERYCRDERGDLVPAIEDPEGRLVPDRRLPSFQLPSWVDVPGFLARHIASRDSVEDAAAFPFDVTSALHFSNGGGIYLATDKRAGRQVVLREARPHAGIDAGGRDAVARLIRARDVLDVLAGLSCVPDCYGYHICWEHHFLAEEYIAGVPLWNEITSRFPLIHPDPSDQDLAGYTRWALDMLADIDRAIGQVHERGVAFGDLHPYNVIIRPDGRICLIDFETASMAGERDVAAVGAPGYTPPDARRGFARDRYALACMRIAAFHPLTTLFPLDPAKARMAVRVIDQEFPVPAGYGRDILAELDLPAARPWNVPRPGRTGAGRDAAVLAARMWDGDNVRAELEASLAQAITASATLRRRDRLFPGDVQQFNSGGLGIACGAAGVLHALAAAGCPLDPDHEEWLINAARHARPERHVGLCYGLHGVACVLDELGHHGAALDVLDKAASTGLDGLPSGLARGLAGIGLTLVHFAGRTRDRRFEQAALSVADRLAHLPALPRTAGLMHGGSGLALFFIRLYQRVGDEGLLDLAHAELGRELDACVTLSDGTMQLDEGWRVLPHLESGSAGIALVLDEFLGHRTTERFDAAIDPIIRAATPSFVLFSGLFNGRSGLIAVLARLRDAGRRPRPLLQPVIDRHVRRLAWHLVRYRGKAAYPGDHLLRLSMDLATGSAGVLLALRASAVDGVPVLPLVTGAAIARTAGTGSQPRDCIRVMAKGGERT